MRAVVSFPNHSRSYDPTRRAVRFWAPASPWQNSFAERLIGSIRRECVDHIIVLGEMHLRRVLKSYADYYNSVRTHRSLNKDAPVSRPVQQAGVISSRAILGGLHHHYARV
jgi:transposase InsO family protein